MTDSQPKAGQARPPRRRARENYALSNGAAGMLVVGRGYNSQPAAREAASSLEVLYKFSTECESDDVLEELENPTIQKKKPSPVKVIRTPVDTWTFVRLPSEDTSDEFCPGDTTPELVSLFSLFSSTVDEETFNKALGPFYTSGAVIPPGRKRLTTKVVTPDAACAELLKAGATKRLEYKDMTRVLPITVTIESPTPSRFIPTLHSVIADGALEDAIIQVLPLVLKRIEESNEEITKMAGGKTDAVLKRLRRIVVGVYCHQNYYDRYPESSSLFSRLIRSTVLVPELLRLSSSKRLAENGLCIDVNSLLNVLPDELHSAAKKIAGNHKSSSDLVPVIVLPQLGPEHADVLLNAIVLKNAAFAGISTLT